MASSDQSFGQFVAETMDDLPAVFARFAQMRAEQPVLYSTDCERLPIDPGPVWHIFRYADVQRVMNDPATFASSDTFSDPRILGTFLVRDPPEHKKLRAIVDKAFTRPMVQRLAGRVKELTQKLLDEVKTKNEIDVVEALALPLPTRVIADLLGCPVEDGPKFHHWTGRDVDSAKEMAAYFSGLLEDRRRAPREDLISALASAEVDGERLTEDELINFCFLLLAGGLLTTANAVTSALYLFTETPGVVERLKAEPALMPKAIEEVIRYFPPAACIFRRTKRPIEIAGQQIPENNLIAAWLGSANRDAAQFPDGERFIADRDPNRHLSFGYGIHYCIGAYLTRMEAGIALPMILDQLKDLRRKPGPLSVYTGQIFVMHTLPMTFRT